MSMYFLPALVSLLLKLFVLSIVVRGGKVSVLFLSLICVFALHNGIELVGYVQHLNSQTIDIYFRLYYVATIYLLMYILLHGLTSSKFENVFITTVVVAIATFMSLFVLFSDTIIAGQYSIGYSVAAILGPYYSAFKFYVLASLLLSSAALIYRYKSAASQLESTRCLYSLFALSPVILACFLTMLFRILEIDINGAGLLPIATTLFLIIVLKGESKHQLSDIRRFLPLSPERAISENVMKMVNTYVNQGQKADAYKKLQAGIEKEIIFYTLNKCNNNISKTTQMMGLKNRSTLYSMMKRQKIDHNKLKTIKN